MDTKNKNIINALPYEVAHCISGLDEKTVSGITEIRLRSGKPAAFRIHNRIVYAEASGYSIIPNCRSIIITRSQLEDCFFKLCNHSVHSHENEISQGYISLSGGCRAGVCGTVVSRSDGSVGLRDISSINIRIAHEVKGCAVTLSNKCQGGVLICGAVHSGKTTLLRDYIRELSDGGKTVALIDCRGEISGSYQGVPTLDIGVNTDVIVGGSKQTGIENAIRAMSPDVVAFDEIGNAQELEAIKSCLNCGVSVVTTLHVNDINELIIRNRNLPVLNTDAFQDIVVLDKEYNQLFYKKENLVVKDNRRINDSHTLYINRVD